jgi:3-oxoacyl-[acyl-carrier-protein] synthase III
MASSGPMSCRPVGIGSAVPSTRITNFDLEQVVETSDEWIQTRTGIGARRVLVDASHAEGDTTHPPESLRDLSVRASRAALEMAGLEATDIDMVICCTSTPDDLFGDAPSVAAMLGCSTGTVAFDLTAACSGFLFGIVTAGQFLSASSSKTALVVGADALSRWVDWEDRNSCILFGDGAGAMILQSTKSSENSPGVLGYAAHSNGLGYCDLQLGYVILANLFAIDVIF